MLINLIPDNSKSLLKPPISERLKLGCVELAPREDGGKHIASDKEEIITVLTGEATVIDSGKEIKVREGQAYYVAPGHEHDVINKSNKPVRYTYTAVLL